VHVGVAIADQEPLEEWLSARAGRRVRIAVPRRGDKRALLDLATRNAVIAYQSRADESGVSHAEALDTLRLVLGLPALPRRIEAFDISTIQGSETVASLVVCEDGRMRRGEYRKFRIRGLQAPSSRLQRNRGVTGRRLAAGASTDLGPGPGSQEPAESHGDGRILDDFASMHEVVLRRYRRAAESGGPFPDLILIDGGKGQLAAAYDAMRALGLERLVAIGLAKEEELVFTRDSADAIRLPPEGQALRLLQRIRDEAHRFAVTFHRRARTLRDIRSELDGVTGIGPRRRKALLIRFGSLSGVRRATREELTSVVGAKAADAVLEHFRVDVRH
jgi:excinuclease ABC subunit C